MSQLTINLLPDGIPVPPVYFYTASDYFPQADMGYAPGAQNFYQILLVLAGTGILRCRGNSYPLKRGCAFFTAQGCPSEYRNTGGLVTAFLTARGSAMPELLAHYGCGEFLFTDRASPDKYLPAIRHIIREYYDRKREGQLSSYVYSFFVDFLEQFSGTPLSPLEQTALFIERHFTQKLTLPQLAAVSGISVSKLCHDFKKQYGCTVFTYILNLRLTYARSFLRVSREARTKDAAIGCGFEDISYFCKAYKKKFGRTPAQDRST